MIAGLQTHIEGWTDPAELQFAYDNRFRMARIAAMHCSEEVMLQNMLDARAVGFRLLVTLADPHRIRLMNAGDLVECRNEDDGDLLASTYREILEEFCEVGREVGIGIVGPTCSNTNIKCVRWARSIRGDAWPKGMVGLSWHSYDPHENTLFKEVRALADGMPIIWSEFGYPSSGSEEEQAEKVKALWPLYANDYAACLYQIHDGLRSDEKYGIRAVDAEGKAAHWKPVAYTAPEVTDMPIPIIPAPDPEPIAPIEPSPVVTPDDDELVALRTALSVAYARITELESKQGLEVHKALQRKHKMKHPEHKDKFTILHPDGDAVLSVQPDGRIEKRALGTHGDYETFTDDGQKANFENVVPGYTFSILLVG